MFLCTVYSMAQVLSTSKEYMIVEEDLSFQDINIYHENVPLPVFPLPIFERVSLFSLPSPITIKSLPPLSLSPDPVTYLLLEILKKHCQHWSRSLGIENRIGFMHV